MDTLYCTNIDLISNWNSNGRLLAAKSALLYQYLEKVLISFSLVLTNNATLLAISSLRFLLTISSASLYFRCTIELCMHNTL